LTLSNFLHLRAIAIPKLIAHFETLFSVKLTDESKTLRDVLSQIDSRLFQSYTTPTAEKLTTIITAGINSRSWSPGNDVANNRPKDVRPYIYESLLTLVLVHAEVTSTIPPISAATPSESNSTSSPTTTSAPSLPVTTSPLIHRILTFHLTHASQTLLATFRKRQSFSLADLIQATLDVEFFSQTLHAYSSSEASSAQSDLYLAMDERTDHDARSALQSELPEMRAVLKRLKEGTKGEFSCFKRPAREPGSGEGRGRGRTATNGGAGAPGRS
jgi:exocyst complex component 2